LQTVALALGGERGSCAAKRATFRTLQGFLGSAQRRTGHPRELQLLRRPRMDYGQRPRRRRWTLVCRGSRGILPQVYDLVMLLAMRLLPERRKQSRPKIGDTQSLVGMRRLMHLATAHALLEENKAVGLNGGKIFLALEE
jgi:hypothetical protein